MKALKEKRISLRSLWRRGLVILSLFALVFASCGESDSGGESGGSPIRYIEVIDNPANDQYYGKPVDLTGTTIVVHYENGKKETVTDTSKFTAYPRIVTGYYDVPSSGRPGFVGMDRCKITYKDATAWAPFDGKVWGIWTTNTLQSGWGPIGVPAGRGDPGLYDLGIHVTGYEKLKRVAYADDEEFDISALTVEADYFYVNPDNGWIERDRKNISLDDVTWRILPSYEINVDKTSRGYLYITVGKDYYEFMNLLMGGRGDVDPPSGTAFYEGITTSLQMDTVYIVDKIDLKTQPDLGDYFYWQPNTFGAWVDRLGKDARLVVSYTGGAPDKEFLISDLARRAPYPENKKIWHNANPGMEGAEEQNPTFIDYDFDIVPIRYPLTVKKNPNPSIILYYRGAEKEIPVDVFTTLVSVSAVSKSGGDIIFRPNKLRDNDIGNDGAPGKGDLADLMTVTATYQAYNNANAQATVELMYKGHLGNLLWRKYGKTLGDVEAGATNGGEYIPYYTFSKTPDDGLLDDDDNYAKVYGKWQKAADSWRDKGKGKESLVAAVTIGHKVNELELYYPEYNSGTLGTGPFDPANTGGPLYSSPDAQAGLEYMYEASSGNWQTARHYFQWFDTGVPEGEVPFYLETLKRAYYGNVAIPNWDYKTWSYVASWDIEEPLPIYGSGTDSGLKVAKTRTDKPQVTWIVQE